MGSKSHARIAGAGMTDVGGHLDESLSALALNAIGADYAASAIQPEDVDLVVCANSMAGPLQGQESVRGQVLFARGQFRGKPIVNVENACASGATAVQVASWALRSGAARTALPGHPVGATGIAQLRELTSPLMGDAGWCQVANAAVGFAEAHGGLVGNDVAVASVTIRERVS